MFGSELALNPNQPPLSRWKYRILGQTSVGKLLRGLRAIRASKPLIHENLRVLEIGSNTGELLYHQAKGYPHCQWFGLEIDPKKAGICAGIKKRLPVGNLHFVAADIFRCPLREKFNLIYCIDVLEHLEDEEAALRIMHDLLEDHGHLVLHYPPDYRRFANLRLSRDRKEDLGHQHDGIPFHRVRDRIENAGFQITSIQRSGGLTGALAYWMDVLFFMILRLRFPFSLPVLPIVVSFAYLDLLLFPKGWFGGHLVTARATRPTDAG